MRQFELEKAIAEGKDLMMSKYRFYGMWSTPKRVSAKVALKKSKVRVGDGWCPYSFELCEED